MGYNIRLQIIKWLATNTIVKPIKFIIKKVKMKKLFKTLLFLIPFASSAQ